MRPPCYTNLKLVRKQPVGVDAPQLCGVVYAHTYQPNDLLLVGAHGPRRLSSLGRSCIASYAAARPAVTRVRSLDSPINRLGGTVSTNELAARTRTFVWTCSRYRCCIVALCALLIMIPLPTSDAQAAQADTFHLYVDGVAQVYMSTCPLDGWIPDTVTVCDDWYIQYFREGQPSAMREQPWILLVQHGTLLVHPDGTFTVVHDRSGQIENPQGSFDSKKYAAAYVTGSVTMSDGTELAVDLTWDMSLAKLHHSGNNGPFLDGSGLARHYADRCFTLVQNAHQQWRGAAPGRISGVVEGVDVQSRYLAPTEPFVAGKSVFTFVAVTHGGCARE